MRSSQRLVQKITARQQEIIDLSAQLVRLPSPNPPGDTQAVAAHVQQFLQSRGLPVEIEAGQPHSPNLISSVSGVKSGRHLVLLTHMDTYPLGDLSQWYRPPFDAQVENGRMYGRGTGDMKAGLAGMLFTYAAAASQRSFAGRLTLLAVSDELTFSPYGAPLVLERRPEVIGDAVLGSEPTEPNQVLFGEKGMVWFEVLCQTQSGHGAYVAELKNAIQTMLEVLGEIGALHGREAVLPEKVLRSMRSTWPTDGPSLEGVEKLVRQVTVNFGVIEGGRKVNMIADQCRAEVDIRVPPGMHCQKVVDFLEQVFAAHPNARYRIIQSFEPTWSDTDQPIFQILKRNIAAVTGAGCRFEVGLPASDARLFARRNVPAALYGPLAYQEGGPDESVVIENVIDCARVYALTIGDYLEFER